MVRRRSSKELPKGSPLIHFPVSFFKHTPAQYGFSPGPCEDNSITATASQAVVFHNSSPAGNNADHFFGLSLATLAVPDFVPTLS